MSDYLSVPSGRHTPLRQVCCHGPGKSFPYSLPSVGPGADPGVQAVSPQMTWSESRHRPGSRLPLLSARPVVTSVAFTRDGATCKRQHTSDSSLLLIYRPRKDERLSWPSWLTCSGWFTHISGHPSAAGLAQDRESSPVRDRRSTTVPRHQPRARWPGNINRLLHSRSHAAALHAAANAGSATLSADV